MNVDSSLSCSYLVPVSKVLNNSRQLSLMSENLLNIVYLTTRDVLNSLSTPASTRISSYCIADIGDSSQAVNRNLPGITIRALTNNSNYSRFVPESYQVRYIIGLMPPIIVSAISQPFCLRRQLQPQTRLISHESKVFEGSEAIVSNLSVPF